MKYTKITGKTYEEVVAANTHNAKYNIENYKLSSDIYDTHLENTLTDKGVLVVDYSDEIHVYNLFESDNDTKLSGIKLDNTSLKNSVNNIESMHRIVLYKDSKNNYYIKPEAVGIADDKFCYDIDIDSLKYGDTVLFRESDKFDYFAFAGKIDKIYEFGFNYKNYLSFNVLNNGSYTVTFTNYTGKYVSLENNTFAFYETKNNDDIFCKITGKDGCPYIIILEVY